MSPLFIRVAAASGVLLAAFCGLAQPAGYTQGTVLTIDHTKIPNSDLANFPLLISAQADALRSAAYGGQMQSPNAYDIVFSSDPAGNNLLPYERTRHDLTFGRVVYWVQIPLVSHTSDTSVYIWYGNPAVTTDQSQPSAVWDANYKGVWHLSDNGSSTNVQDSTANGHNGVNQSNTNTRLTLGRINNATALRYQSMTDHTNVASSKGGDFDFTSGSFTFEFWVNPAAILNGAAMLGNGGYNQNSGYEMLTLNNGTLVFDGYNGSVGSSVITNGKVGVGQWTHVAVLRNGSSLQVYLNGRLDSSINNFASPSTSGWPFTIGGDYGSNNRGGGFAGNMQEFRVSNTNRSGDWIAASYNNQSNPNTFFSLTPWEMRSSGVPPLCNAGAPQSFRAGYTAALDGSGSASLMGGTLSYSWQQIQSAAVGVPLQRLRWSSHTVAKPTITGLVSGPADFSLTVTQSDGESSTCVVNHGAVATDNNGAVIASTGNANMDSAIANLLGPMVQLGKNPWPFFDTAVQADAAIQIAGMDTVYQPYWDIPGPGTVSVTTGSTTLIGNGTHFLTTFCNADGTPLAGYGSIAPIIWYPINNPDRPGETGRRVGGPGSGPYIAGCQSDTQLTMLAPWQSDVAACPTGQAPPCWLNYAVAFGPGQTNNAWNFGGAPADFYDAVVAYYALYFRSGQDTYLIAARKFADRFWMCPQIDRGRTFETYNVFGWQPMFRNWAMMGMVLRALDTADGHEDMWPGLHLVWTRAMGPYWLGYYPDPKKIGFDGREYGYGLAQLAYCALYDEDPNWQLNCRTAIKNTFATSGPGYLNIWPQSQDVDGGWKMLFGHGTLNSWYTKTSVNLRNGSTAVSCNGDCGFPSWQFALSALGGYPIWFFSKPSVAPTSNGEGDPDYYCFQLGQPTVGCKYIDSNHFTLDRPYNEPGCDNGCIKGWLFDDEAGNPGNVGYDQEPFFEGILAFAFDLAGRAMACTGNGVPAGCDTPTSTMAFQFNTSAVNWLMQNGYRAATYGMYYVSGGPVCSPPISEQNGYCTGGNAMASREYAADGLRGMMVYYQRTADPAAKAMIDNIYAGLWAKPGTNPIVPSPDGTYDTQFETGGYWMFAGTYGSKLFGQMFGFGRGDTWPVIRVGGAQAPSNVRMYVSGRINDVPGAASFQVVVTQPTGMKSPPVVCTASPCAITVDKHLGNPTLQVMYLSGSGGVVHTGQPFVAVVN